MTRKRRLRLIFIFIGLILIIYGMIVAVDSFNQSIILSFVFRLITGIFITIAGIGLIYLGIKIKQAKK